MGDVQDHLDQAEIESFVTALDFVREYGISVVAAGPGRVVIECRSMKDFPGRRGNSRRCW